MKINTKKILLLATLSVAPLMASESFGGIGVSIYQSRDGVKIAEIIPGTPAAESNLRAGDVIVAVDGVTFKGNTIEESKAMLKDAVMPVSVVLNGDHIDVEFEKQTAWTNTIKSLYISSAEGVFYMDVSFDANGDIKGISEMKF